VVVVGAGPIGLEMAVALKRAGVDYLHFDAKQIGYTISWFAPQTRFFSSNERIAIAGVPLITPDQGKATREEYLAYLRQVVSLYDLKVNTYEPVTDIRRDGYGFVLATRRGSAGGQNGKPRTVRCKRLVLVTGGTDRPRKMGIPGEDLPHVHSYFQDPHTYFQQRLLIVGGKNSAVEAVLRCHHAGANVALSYRREKLPEKNIKYWLWPEINGLIGSGRIEAHSNSQPVKITPTHVTLRVGDDLRDVPVDFVLSLIGYEQDTSLFSKAGLAMQGSCCAPQFDPATMESTIPNLYVAGTSAGGTQEKYQVFIENCHVHVDRILAALTGQRAATEAPAFEQPES
jgi:thioredoxin reductase (NADPH)